MNKCKSKCEKHKKKKCGCSNTKHKFYTLTTGVLMKNTSTLSAIINMANLGQNNSYPITCEVWDWSSYSDPVKVPIFIGENKQVKYSYNLEPQNLAVMYAPLDREIKYFEVRVTIPADKNIVVECYERSPKFSTSRSLENFQQ